MHENLLLTNPQKCIYYFFMKNRTAIKEYTYDNELKLLQLFSNLFHSTDTEDAFLNSTKLRHIINNSDTPCISLKTFDEGIHLLNKQFSTRTSENPVFQNYAEFKNLPLHTDVFYLRLPLCLCFDLNRKVLFNKHETDDAAIKSYEKLNHILGLKTPAPSHIHTFDIHNLYVPPFLAPLFVGIIGSLKKEKSSWRSFRKTVLEISESFYNENHLEINQYLPEAADIRKDLYTYWLEIHFPDPLFDLLAEFDKIITSGIDPMLSHNLQYLASTLSEEIFLTRIKTNDIFQKLKDILELYLTTPMIDPKTLELRNLDLFKEYETTLQKSRTEEILHIQELCLKQNSTP